MDLDKAHEHPAQLGVRGFKGGPARDHAQRISLFWTPMTLIQRRFGGWRRPCLMFSVANGYPISSTF